MIGVHDISNTFHVPVLLANQRIHQHICKQLDLYSLSHVSKEPSLESWHEMALRIDTCKNSTTIRHIQICIVGKYVGLSDSYLSVLKSLKHSAVQQEVEVDITWIDSSDLEEILASDSTEQSELDVNHEKEIRYANAWHLLKTCDGILVPGGFGVRGIEGKIAAAKYAREAKKPYLGLCLGMQIMVIEYCRSILGMSLANSQEFNNNDVSDNSVIVFMPEINQHVMGGTMRVGARVTNVTTQIKVRNNEEVSLERSIASEVYGIPLSESEGKILERRS